MATLELTDVRPKDDLAAPDGNYSAEESLNMPAELWAPPLAPFGDEDGFLAPEPSRGKLIAGTAIVAALGVAVFASFFLASLGAKPPAETAQTVPVASTEAEAQVQPAPTVAQPSPGASSVVPSPDVPASLAAEASPQVAPWAGTPQTASTAQSPHDLVFLQRPGVNIRSGPSGTAPALGTAPQGTQFTATGREGDWVQVENARLKGWINSQFLAPDKPQ
jgi:Bacterial SH3 domain